MELHECIRILLNFSLNHGRIGPLFVIRTGIHLSGKLWKKTAVYKSHYSSDAIAQTLTGVNVVISCLTVFPLQEELALISASSRAGLGRYVPSLFGPCCPPKGVMMGRELV